MSTALLKVYMALLKVSTALVKVCTALLNVSTALVKVSTALVPDILGSLVAFSDKKCVRFQSKQIF